MYFIKAELADGITIRSEITGENVYCTCPKCGAEVPVDLGAAVTEDGLDLYGTSVFCEACAKAFHAESYMDKLFGQKEAAPDAVNIKSGKAELVNTPASASILPDGQEDCKR